MRRYSLLVVILVLEVTACKKELTKTTRPDNTNANNAADIGLPPPICSGNNWTVVSTYPTHGIGLVYNNKLYVPDGLNGSVHIYDGSGWTNISSDVPLSTSGEYYGVDYTELVTFTIGNKGYMSGSDNPPWIPDVFWEYNFNSNTWRQRASLPGVHRYNAGCFSIGTKGYMVGGFLTFQTSPPSSPNFLSDVWEYNQDNNNWTRKVDLPFEGRGGGTGFSIGNKGYMVGGGVPPGQWDLVRQLLQYNPATDSWTKKAPLPGVARQDASVFGIGNIGYAGGGIEANSVSLDDFYQYIPATDSWTQIADLSTLLTVNAFFGFSINSTGYCVAELNGTNYVYKYTPQICTQ